MSAPTVEQQVNLYQPILGAEKRLFSARAIGVCLALLAISLSALGGYGAWRTSQVERSIAELEKRQAAELVTAERAGLALNPGKSLVELDAEAKDLGGRHRRTGAGARHSQARRGLPGDRLCGPARRLGPPPN